MAGAIDNVNMGRQMGYLSVPEGLLVSIDDTQRMEPYRLVLLTTGSQGEPTSTLGRIGNQDRHCITVILGDTVVISATAIPGKERPLVALSITCFAKARLFCTIASPSYTYMDMPVPRS